MNGFEVANCCSCEFYIRLQNRQERNVGKCIRNAPVGKAITLEEADKCRDFFYIFPLVLSFNKCGEYKHAPEPYSSGHDNDTEGKMDAFIDGLEKQRMGK